MALEVDRVASLRVHFPNNYLIALVVGRYRSTQLALVINM